MNIQHTAYARSRERNESLKRPACSGLLLSSITDSSGFYGFSLPGYRMMMFILHTNTG